MNDTYITINGHVGNAPKYFESQGKTPFVSFRLGSTSWHNQVSATEWYTVKAFGNLARNIAESIQKGHPILARGRLVTETYEAAEGEKTDLVVIADAVGMEMSRGVASFAKVERGEALSE